MPPASALLYALRQGSLLSPDQLLEVERLALTLSSAEALAAALVGRGWLTQFQADELAAGRGVGLLVGSYVLLQKLGEGGMGEVFRARHRLMGREVALKRMRAALMAQPGLVERFLREVRAAAMLSHPNVVQVHDAGEANGSYFLAMELLRGVNLADYLARRGPLPVAEAIEYVRQACVGMQHAHEMGLVHRDLKPANLWLTQQRQIKILDMGLALMAEVSVMTNAGGVFGSVDYLAPEQAIDSHNVDVRADVYSLGCTLYQLLAGRTPFQHAHPATRPSLHVSQQPPAIEQHCPDVSPVVAAVVRKMMARRREDRFQTPAEAARALASLPRQAGARRAPVAPPISGALPPVAATADVFDQPTIIHPVALPLNHFPAASQPYAPPDGAPTAFVPSTSGQRGGGGVKMLLAGLLGGMLLMGGLGALAVPFLLGGGKDGGKHAKDGSDKGRDEPNRQDNEKPAGKDSGAVEGKSKRPADKDGKKGDATKGKVVQAGPLNEKQENSIGMRFARIPKGKFLMGAEDDKAAFGPEKPQHEVEITRDFYLGSYEVTQKQFQEVMRTNPSYFSRDGKPSEKVTYDFGNPGGGKARVEGKDTGDFPVDNVTWDEAQEFIKRLNEREKQTLWGWEYHLPTEAQWEYACRGGTVNKKYHFGDTLSPHLANRLASNLGRPEKVGAYPANAFGLYDMHGNVWEWCHDRFDANYYHNSPRADPPGPPDGLSRVVRGGSSDADDNSCRSAYRASWAQGRGFTTLGFRVALVPAGK